MKSSIALITAAALCLHLPVAPARAEMTDTQKAAAALAILGIAALAHHKHHYRDGYRPANDVETAEFERGYRDGMHGYPYWEHSRTQGYVQGYRAGENERNNSLAHRREAANEKAPPMAYSGCADIVARNFAVGKGQVHFIKARSPQKHEWEIEASVGYEHMVCTMRDTGELIDLRGGKL